MAMKKLYCQQGDLVPVLQVTPTEEYFVIWWEQLEFWMPAN